MKCATKSRRMQVLVWLVWVVVCLVMALVPPQGAVRAGNGQHLPVLAGVVTHDSRDGPLFPWQVRWRWRKWAWRHYQALRQAHQQAVWLARLASAGTLTLAHVVGWITRYQIARQVGSLPALLAVLKELQVSEIINRHCPTRAEIDLGAVATVLILNRLSMPLPLYRVADWAAQTILEDLLGFSMRKLNDDRLARTLDALCSHGSDIWQDVVPQAWLLAQVEPGILFYDTTAFTVHGAYTQSKFVDFGFAHNTPTNKRKFKLALNVSADCHLPLNYRLWSGRTTDMATVAENMAQLKRLLQRNAWASEEVLVIGDRGTLSDQLALGYDDHRLRYLAGLRLLKKEHLALLVGVSESKLYALPLTDDWGPRGSWGCPCEVPFEHAGRRVNHRGLVVLSGPLRTAWRQTRATQLRELHQVLKQIRSQIGQPRYRTLAAVQRRANIAVKASKVGKLVRADAFKHPDGQVDLRWSIDTALLKQAMQKDGRYLLVTNDKSLSPSKMLALYRQKDAVEKRIQVSKSDLKVSPIYLHKDERIEAALLLNMLALLVYSLLEHQVHQNGLSMSARRILAKLESLQVIETYCCDGSRLLRLTPMDDEQAALLHILADVLVQLHGTKEPRSNPVLLMGGVQLALAPPAQPPRRT